MYKRAIILLSFLAYSLTLVHSIVPHHHHEGAKVDSHHHGTGNSHHHHQEEHDERESLSQVFSDATHHPASNVVIHTPQSDILQKNKQSVNLLIFAISQLVFPELKPPDIPAHHQENHYISQQYSFFLLRAPPVA